MKAGWMFFILVISGFTLRAQVYSCRQGEISFFSEALIENIEAHNHGINSYLNVSTKEIAFVVPIRGFKFAKALMQEHFNEKYMESDKYPNATYKGKINGDVDFSKNGTYQVTSSGKLNIHGVEHDINPQGTVIVKSDGIAISCSFNVAINDYNITKPKLLFQNIADTINVKMNADYVPLQKK
jgi:hypothetical protein